MTTKVAFAALAALAGPIASGNVLAQLRPLSTQSGHEIGLSVSDYKYTESGVSLKATKWGIDYTGNQAMGNRWFVRGELRYADGEADYSGTGTQPNNPDWYYEIRGLVGKDYLFRNFALSPYIGLGYRYLFSDLRGVSSTGAAGYRRESHYYTLPIGISHRLDLRNKGQLLTTAEFDYFIRGRQETRLSDLVGFGGFTAATDVTNTQKRGYGWRLSSMYQFRNWSLGPYLMYWHIEESEVSTARVTRFGTTFGLRLVEPANNTQEIGLKAAYRF